MGKPKDKTPTKFGRYQVIQVLASGGMASVYVARDPVLSRPVAIKVLHPHLQTHKALIKRFFQEAQTVAQLRSPFIVEVHDFGKEDDSPFLVMELVDGLSLDGVFQQLAYEPMDPVVAAALMCQAAEGLEAATQRGVVHRDIKPENLLISPKGYLKIADFGIAHVMDHTATKTGAIIGTASYMSPEQADGAKGITSQSDIFSLGSVFYYCLTGRAPFKSDSVPGMLKKIVYEPHLTIQSIRPDTDPFLANLVETLLQKDPLMRGQGPAWLKSELKRYLLNRQVADPVECIKTYLKELAGRGIQTTGFVSPLVIAAALREKELKTSPEAVNAKRLVFVVLGLLLSILVVTTALSWKTVHAWMAPPLKKEAPLFKTPGGSKPEVAAVDLPNLAPPAPTPLEALEEPNSNLQVAGNKTPILKQVRRSVELSQLSIESRPPFVEVTLDGKLIGTTPIEDSKTTSGRHTISLVDQSGMVRKDTVVELRPGSQHFRIVLPVK